MRFQGISEPTDGRSNFDTDMLTFEGTFLWKEAYLVTTVTQ